MFYPEMMSPRAETRDRANTLHRDLWESVYHNPTRRPGQDEQQGDQQDGQQQGTTKPRPKRNS